MRGKEGLYFCRSKWETKPWLPVTATDSITSHILTKQFHLPFYLCRLFFFLHNPRAKVEFNLTAVFYYLYPCAPPLFSGEKITSRLMCKHTWLQTHCKLTRKRAYFKWESISVTTVSSSSFGLVWLGELTKRGAAAVIIIIIPENRTFSFERWQMHQACKYIWGNPKRWQRQTQVNHVSDKLIGRFFPFWAEGLENKACQGNVLNGEQLIHPAEHPVLTSAFLTPL